jgi:hypothetical protein
MKFMQYDIQTINEYYTSQKCCEYYKDLKHYKDKKEISIQIIILF